MLGIGNRQDEDHENVVRATMLRGPRTSNRNTPKSIRVISLKRYMLMLSYCNIFLTLNELLSLLFNYYRLQLKEILLAERLPC